MGLLDTQAQPDQTAGMGLLSQQQGIPPMPPEMQQAIAQMKSAPPQQKQAFMQHIIQTIQQTPKDPMMKQQVIQQFMQAMGEGNGAA
jgi:hypothetical protein